MERVVRLSDVCVAFELRDKDAVVLPTSDDTPQPLEACRVRTLPSAPPGADGPSLALPRRAFMLREAVPVLFGLYTKTVEINGKQTWDADAKVALYESATDMGIQIWKRRRFEELTENGVVKTRVSETIRGRAPPWLKYIVQKETSSLHR